MSPRVPGHTHVNDTIVSFLDRELTRLEMHTTSSFFLLAQAGTQASLYAYRDDICKTRLIFLALVIRFLVLNFT